MLNSQFLSMVPWEDLCQQTRQKIVIDAGHLSIGNTGKCFLLGRCGKGPSESELFTFKMGLELAKRFTDFGKKCSVHLCFSDTSKNFNSLVDREDLKEKIAKNRVLELLPQSYQESLNLFPNISIEFSLQTQNSNFFSGQMKRLKKKIKGFGQAQEVFDATGALFLNDASKDIFGFTHPYLFNMDLEKEILGGDWWLEENAEIHPFDKVRAPSILVKKMGVINVHSKSAGILCPGTYAGLLLGLDSESDRIAIYAREDDEAVGEKLLRGIIGAYIFSPKLSGSCFLLVIPKHSNKIELTVINRQILSQSLSHFNQLLQFFWNSHLKEKYFGYHHPLPVL